MVCAIFDQEVRAKNMAMVKEDFLTFDPPADGPGRWTINAFPPSIRRRMREIVPSAFSAFREPILSIQRARQQAVGRQPMPSSGGRTLCERRRVAHVVRQRHWQRNTRLPSARTIFQRRFPLPSLTGEFLAGCASRPLGRTTLAICSSRATARFSLQAMTTIR